MKSLIERCSADSINIVGKAYTYKSCYNTSRATTIKIFLNKCYNFLRSSAEKTSGVCFRPILFFILILTLGSAIEAQQDVGYALHANIIYRFTKYIDWPDDNNSGDFIIGIVGDSPLFDELQNFTLNKTVGTRRILIKKMSSSADAYNCSILYITEDKSKSLKKIAEITKGSPILIVSECSSTLLKGSCINFVIVNEHLKLEINKTNIEERKLNIASELLRLGTIIR